MWMKQIAFKFFINFERGSLLQNGGNRTCAFICQSRYFLFNEFKKIIEKKCFCVEFSWNNRDTGTNEPVLSKIILANVV